MAKRDQYELDLIKQEATQSALRRLVKHPEWAIFSRVIWERIRLTVRSSGALNEHEPHDCMVSYMKGLQDAIELPMNEANALTQKEYEEQLAETTPGPDEETE